MATEYTVDSEGVLSSKDDEGNIVRYTKEADLLTTKESLDSTQKKLDIAEKAHSSSTTEAETKAGEALSQKLQAEATVERLTDEIKSAGENKEKVESIQKELNTAKELGTSTATKLLDLRKEVIVASYGVPKETVTDKDLAELDHFEEALKAIGKLKGVGNFAVGGNSGSGAGALEGVKPMELARRAYETSNRK